MNQYRRPHPGSNVGRTRGQIAKFVVERVGDLRPELAIQLLHRGERRRQPESRAQRLQSEVILLIDHDAHVGPEKHGRTTANRVLRVQPGQLLAHEMPLV